MGRLRACRADSQARRQEGLVTPPPVKPPRLRKIVNDVTTEAVVSTLADNPAGILVHSDELTGWLNGMDAYRNRGGKDMPFWLQAKDGGSYTVIRKGGDIYAPNCAVSVLGTIQDNVIHKIAPSLTDCGFLQRFMVIYMKKTAK